ncbi:MAG: Kelch repeat-containing protein [Planctomycetota bacterium]
MKARYLRTFVRSRVLSSSAAGLLAGVALLVASDTSAQQLEWRRTDAAAVNSPTLRSDHAMAAFGSSDRVVLFGGYSSQRDATLADTWTWQPSGWQELAIAGPPARRGHAMAYDSARNRVVLFGGRDGSGVLFDHWEYDGVAWQEVGPVAFPSARSGHSMAYDAQRQRIVLFGGVFGGLLLADTWEWDGQSWTQLAISGPSARRAAAMAYDGSEVVLFGGANSTTALADTWTFDGTAWQQQAPTLPPPARVDAAMAREGSEGSLLLYGGSDQNTLPGFWRWSGADWSFEAAGSIAPAPRAEHTMVGLGSAGRLLLFGGDNGGSLRDTWISDTPVSTYGDGCGTPALGFVPLAGVPSPGQSLQADVFNSPAALSVVALGLSDRFFGPLALPAPLDSAGMPGCELLHSAELFGLPTTSTGTAGTQLFSLLLPASAELVGTAIFGQSFAVAPGQNSLQVIASNGIAWRIGCPPTQLSPSIETFSNSVQLDEMASAGSWLGGVGSFGQIGGDARHGAFSIDLGVATGESINGRSVIEIDCNDTVVPGTSTTSGVPEQVVDGRFFFARMHVPTQVHLRFVGDVPAQITVSGDLSIDGVIESDGASQVVHNGNLPLGQAGSLGGAGGGRGGSGGDRCLGVGPGAGEFDGNDGEDLRLAAGHAYGGAAIGTAGRGSALFPASGLAADRLFPTTPPSMPLAYAIGAVAGGSGGGYLSPGGDGAVSGVFSGTTLLPNWPLFAGPVAPGGAAGQLFPIPAGVQSSEHFLVGGSGGGGSASNHSLSLSLGSGFFASGAGGAGGGGALLLRAGHDLTLAAGARVSCVGGSGAVRIGTAVGPQVAPAGGGSGGSVVGQAGRVLANFGTIDVRGGAGGEFSRQSPGGGIGPVGGRVEIDGGDGADGFVRLEAPITSVGSTVPAAGANSSAMLLEQDELVAMQSLAYDVQGACPVEFVRYELDATVDGVATTFSDDPAIAPLAAGAGQPLRLFFQAGVIDGVGGVFVPVGPWRSCVRTTPGESGISVDGGTAYRFRAVFDRNLAADATLDTLRVIVRN